MSTKERIDSFVTSEGRTRARALRRTLKLPDAPPQNQKLHHEPSDAQPPHSEEDTEDREAPPISSTINNRHETRLSADLRRSLKLLDAPPQNQKFHHEPSEAQPPRSDEDRDGAEAPSSTIDHLGPSTSHQLAAIGGNSPQPVNRARAFAPSYSGSGLPDARSIWRKCL